MTNAPPILFRWQQGAFVPARPAMARRAEQYFKEGEELMLVEHHERSMNSHSHFFASVHEAWKNLPENLAWRFPTSEHLRKYALIKAGFYDSYTLPCPSPEAARRMASFMEPMDEFGIISVEGSVVTRYTAKSQSYRHMDKAEFQRSKTEVLEILSNILEVTSGELQANAGQAA